MKIVVLDGYTLNPGDLTWDGFKEIGDIIVHDRVSYKLDEQDQVVEKVGDAEIVLTNKTPIAREVLDYYISNLFEPIPCQITRVKRITV